MLLDEWCTYIKDKEIDANTKLGQVLNEEQAPPSAAKIAEIQGVGQKNQKEVLKSVLSTNFGLKLYKGVSKDLVQFIRVFVDLGEKGSKYESMRIEAFENDLDMNVSLRNFRNMI